MAKIENKGIYIRNLEASDIYYHDVREQDIKTEYTGTIPYSLLSIKLTSLKGFTKSKVNHTIDEFGNESFKYISRDIVNVKFNYGVKELNAFIKERENRISLIKEEIETLANELDSLNSAVESIKDKDSKLNPLTKTALLRKIKIIKSKIKRLTKQQNSTSNLVNQLNALANNTTKSDEEKAEISNKISTGLLRKSLYKNGFSLKHIERDKNGVEETVTINYKLFIRSSSKARNGEVTFINADLYDEMIKWVRMGYEFDEEEIVDVTAIRAYESLVGSTIIDTVKIDPNSILVIDDVKSKFKIDVNVIAKGVDGKLDSVPTENAELVNDIWDGQSLMDYETFFKDKDYSFMLLRNHMFKSAGFSFDLKRFFTDNLPDGETLETWILKDMFGNKIRACDVKLITTPNSLKFLKFAFMETPSQSFEEYAIAPLKVKQKAEKAIYAKWCKLVKKQVFGICKHEKPSQFSNVNDKHVHQLSYQMVNTLLADNDTIDKLSKLEVDYINDLNTNVDVFMNYLEATKADENTNELYINLYKMNNKFANTLMFTQFRSKVVYAYKQNLKEGKIKLESSDYSVLVSTPIHMAFHAIGLLDTNTVEIKANKAIMTLKGNEVYSTLFPFSEEDKTVWIVGHRSPHTSFSNVCMFENTYNELIERYMHNISKNIVVVNSHKSDLMERGSGLDFDSDSMHLTDHPLMIELGHKARKYATCINEIPVAKKSTYRLSPDDLATLDDAIAISGSKIGEVANAAQFACSVYQHFTYLIDNNNDSDTDPLQLKYWEDCQTKSKKYIDLAIALSTCVIDSAKKSFSISIASEINTMRNALNAMYRGDINKEWANETAANKDTSVYKPLFFENIERDKNEKLKKKDKEIKTKYVKYHTPMDYLQETVKAIAGAPKTDKTNIFSLVNEIDINDANRNQYNKLLVISEELNSFHAKKKMNNYNAEEQQILFINHITSIKKEVSKLKIKKENIYKLMDESYRKKNNHHKLLKIISVYHFEEFNKLFI